MSRWKAAGIHLSISALIGLIVLSLLFLVWYPSPYFKASGGQELTLLLLGVDLVLGPLLTLVVFKAGKKSLRFDLSVIAVLQLSALLYGLHVIAQARPAFVVGAAGRFVVAAANEIEDKDLAMGREPEFRTLSWTGPRIVAARLPTDVEERNTLTFSAAAGRDVQVFPRYFVPYGSEVDALLKQAKSIGELRASHPDAASQIEQWLLSHRRTEADTVWLPARARSTGLTVFLDKRSGDVLGVASIDPW